jgi:hypothetical protein
MNDQDVRNFLERMATEEPVPFHDPAPLARRAQRRAARTIVLGGVGLVVAVALVLAGASRLPGTSAQLVSGTDTTQSPPTETTHGFSTFTSAVQGITIDYPSGWSVRSATKPWNEGPVTFAASDVDVIFDPSLRGDVYLALASEPLGDGAGSSWPTQPPSSTGICADATGMDGGSITVDGAHGWIERCGSPTAGGHFLSVATDARGYVVYLHVANDRALQRTYDADFFDSLVARVAFEPPTTTLVSPDQSATP